MLICLHINGNDSWFIKICAKMHAVACVVCADSLHLYTSTEASSTLLLLILNRLLNNEGYSLLNIEGFSI